MADHTGTPNLADSKAEAREGVARAHREALGGEPDPMTFFPPSFILGIVGFYIFKELSGFVSCVINFCFTFCPCKICWIYFDILFLVF